VLPVGPARCICVCYAPHEVRPYLVFSTALAVFVVVWRRRRSRPVGRRLVPDEQSCHRRSEAYWPTVEIGRFGLV
jgi:hypothetical protein